MRWSKAFIPTLRDNPADAESAAAQLLVRAGFVRRAAPGEFSLLPLGQRTFLKIAHMVRRELAAAGGQEFKIAQEGVFTEIARNELRSYKDLPQIWYAIQPQSAEETGAKSGLLRLRRFTTVTCWLLDLGGDGLEGRRQSLQQPCLNVLGRCGLDVVTVETGAASSRFLVRAEQGEGAVVGCKCGYAADRERAASRLPAVTDSGDAGEVRQVATPGQKTIAEVSRFLEVPASRQMKTLVYVAGNRPVVFLVRGDHQLSESKARAALRAQQLRPALPEEMRAVFGADPGSLGPVGLQGTQVFADHELQGRRNMICGANRDDYHLTGVTPGVDFQPVWADLRTVEPGESCVRCGRPLEIYSATEVGRITKPGTWPEPNDVPRVLAADGTQSAISTITCVVGLEQILAAVVESHHDADGIVWPPEIAPYSVVVTPVTLKGEVGEAAERIYSDLARSGYDVLLDDRPERPGVKFKDADLIGIPHRVVLGGEKLKQGKVELFDRATKTTALVNLDALVSKIGDVPPVNLFS